MKRVLTLARAAGLSLLCATSAVAAGNPVATADALDRYLDGFQSARMEFTQLVTDASGTEIEKGYGTLAVQRPGKFRWDYHLKEDDVPTSPSSQPNAPASSRPAAEDTGQLLVADGRNLWFFDRELDQVTVKPVEAGLSSTPVMLLTGSTQQLHQHFDVSGDGDAEGLTWVRVTPREASADFTRARLAFSGGQLLRMQIDDKTGQKVRIQFSRSERNVPIDASLLQFSPPRGADLIGKPKT